MRGEDDLARLAASFNQMATNLQRQIRQLEDLSRVQRRFVSDVSHELRTPLTTVRMAADVLHEARDGLRPGDRARSPSCCRPSSTGSRRCSPTCSRSAGTTRAPPCSTPSRSTCAPSRGGCSRRRSRSPTQGIGAAARLPDVALRRRGRHPPDRAGAAQPGRQRDRARRGTRRSSSASRGDDDAVAVAVRDHGVGLRPGEAALVFNRFWRADPARARTTGGTGLGLSIALEDARLHGGWLQAWGEPGDGCAVPADPAAARRRRARRQSPIPLEPADSRRRRSGMLAGLRGGALR